MLKDFQWNRIASQKEAVLWMTLLSLVLGVAAKRFFSPLTEKLRDTEAQIAAKQAEIKVYQGLKQRRAVPTSPAGPNDSGRLLLSRKVQDSFLKSNMAPDVVVSELLTHLTLPQFSKAVLLEGFSFTGEKKQPGYSEMNLDLKIVGTYEGIANYLMAVRELPYLLKVESVALKPYDVKDLSRVELNAKGILYVGDKNASLASTKFSRSDTAIDLLPEMSRKKAYSPFLAQSREESAWSLRELKLTSTLAGGSRPTALINGKIFELGEQIAEFKIAEVRAQEIVLQRGDVRYVLKLTEKLDDAPPSAGEKGREGAFDSNPASGTDEARLVEEKASSEDAEREGSGESGDGEAGSAGRVEEGEEIEAYRKNEHGIFNEEKAEVAAASPAAIPPGETPESPEAEARTTSKLNPNNVEDIEGVKFEDLEDPAEVSAL